MGKNWCIAAKTENWNVSIAGVYMRAIQVVKADIMFAASVCEFRRFNKECIGKRCMYFSPGL